MVGGGDNEGRVYMCIYCREGGCLDDGINVYIGGIKLLVERMLPCGISCVIVWMSDLGVLSM